MRLKHVRVLGWMTSTAQAEYIGLIGSCWQTLDIPYADRVLLEEMPIGLLYIPGADD